jgi:hypothetical protein
MSDDLDGRLRRALRPVDPGERFTQSVLSRIANEPEQATSRLPAGRMRWASVALAASIILGVLVAQQWQVRRTRAGLEARRQLLEALHVTSDKLDIAYRAVNDADGSSATPDAERGT